ncbi:hypothetical protein C8R48DRAFT_667352 [Suillus tomentosus]|nr:hypothetical protein C8R48DRAFT_667352 [Suillus tomentosus]
MQWKRQGAHARQVEAAEPEHGAVSLASQASGPSGYQGWSRVAVIYQTVTKERDFASCHDTDHIRVSAYCLFGCLYMFSVAVFAFFCDLLLLMCLRDYNFERIRTPMSVYLDYNSQAEGSWHHGLSFMRAHAVPGTRIGQFMLFRSALSPNGSRVGLFSVRMFEVWCKCSMRSAPLLGTSESS